MMITPRVAGAEAFHFDRVDPNLAKRSERRLDVYIQIADFKDSELFSSTTQMAQQHNSQIIPPDL
ncbi:hypothetical protein IFM47457_06529 [Aspergillus lentulus]|nr:hypothetical protein IFM47457_06529 [Aspergillus lentulus]